MSCKCFSCGKRYKVDLTVPNELWERIKPTGLAPGAGLLCGSCIMERVEGLGEYGELPLNDIVALTEEIELLKKRLRKHNAKKALADALAEAGKCANDRAKEYRDLECYAIWGVGVKPCKECSKEGILLYELCQCIDNHEDALQAYREGE